MNLEPIIQSKVSQKEKEKYCILMDKYCRRKWQTIQNSCWRIPTDREAWKATALGVANSQIWLKWLSMQACMHAMHKYGISEDGIMILHAGQQRRHRHKEKKNVDPVGEGEGGMTWENNIETYITICKIDSQLDCGVWCRAPKACALWQPERMEWGGRWNTYIPMANSWWFMAETVTILWRNYPTIQINKF